MKKNGQRIFRLSLFLALLALNGAARAAPSFPPPMVRSLTEAAIQSTDASEKAGLQIVRAREVMDWVRVWEQMMADQARRRRPPGAPPAGQPGGTLPAPPAGKRPTQGPPPTQQFSVHVDNDGFDATGIWREGIFYTNRDLTGRLDRLSTLYMHSKGSNAINTFYSAPLGKSGAVLDLSYLTSASEVIGKKGRAFGNHGFSWSAGLDLRYPLAADRDRRIEIGLAYDFTRQNSDMDHLPRLGTRAQVLRSRYNRFTPHISFAHYGDSSLLYHRHEAVLGSASTLAHGHQHYAKYRLQAIYRKRYAHGQMLKARLSGQISGEERLASLERFYIGGEASVRGYRNALISGDHGLAAGLEYQVPLSKDGRFSAFTFVDYGRVYGDSAPSRETMMLGTGLGLSYNTRDIHATLTLGFPLERRIAGERVSTTRLHFLLHASF